ncbi:hypothetical protein C8F01DRAFT_1079661 [Mycena amicta]|nr:hypothetical protein C8F01DRAFT_1079661 [Mycena amicta]
MRSRDYGSWVTNRVVVLWATLGGHLAAFSEFGGQMPCRSMQTFWSAIYALINKKLSVYNFTRRGKVIAASKLVNKAVRPTSGNARYRLFRFILGVLYHINFVAFRLTPACTEIDVFKIFSLFSGRPEVSRFSGMKRNTLRVAHQHVKIRILRIIAPALKATTTPVADGARRTHPLHDAGCGATQLGTWCVLRMREARKEDQGSSKIQTDSTYNKSAILNRSQQRREAVKKQYWKASWVVQHQKSPGICEGEPPVL